MTAWMLVLASWLPAKALALSLVLPGAGEASLGYSARAVPFWTAEAASWVSLFAFKNLEWRTQETYRGFAYHHAGADARRTDEAYWHALEFYRDREAYEEALWMEARALYPDDPEAQAAYVARHDVGGTWAWPSRDLWFRFQDLRERARSYESWATLSLGLLVANRLASVIDVFLLSHSRGRVGFDFQGNPRRVQAGIRWHP